MTIGKSTYFFSLFLVSLVTFVASEAFFYSIIMKDPLPKLTGEKASSNTSKQKSVTRSDIPLVPNDNWEFFSTQIVPYIGKLNKGNEDRHVTLIEEFDAKVNKIELPAGKIIINMVGEKGEHLMYLRFNSNYIERGQLLFSKIENKVKIPLKLQDLKIGQWVHFYESQDLTDPKGKGIYELIFIEK
ncbi:MAG: hypothetical protein WA061_05515 [Microgenomates group bacterium]